MNILTKPNIPSQSLPINFSSISFRLKSYNVDDIRNISHCQQKVSQTEDNTKRERDCQLPIDEIPSQHPTPSC